MTFQPCPGIAEVGLQVQDFEGDIAENIIHVSNGGSSAWSTANLTTLANAIDTWSTTGDGAGNKFLSPISSADTLIQIHTRDLTVANSNEYNKTVSHAGSEVGTKIQAGISKALTLRTGLAGRSQRGRVFLFGLTSWAVSSTDVNNFDSTNLNKCELAWGSLIPAIHAANAAWDWVVLSRFSGVNQTTGKPIARDHGVGTPVQSVGHSKLSFDYQRRRAPGHARHH